MVPNSTFLCTEATTVGVEVVLIHFEYFKGWCRSTTSSVRVQFLGSCGFEPCSGNLILVVYGHSVLDCKSPCAISWKRGHQERIVAIGSVAHRIGKFSTTRQQCSLHFPELLRVSLLNRVVECINPGWMNRQANSPWQYLQFAWLEAVVWQMERERRRSKSQPNRAGISNGKLCN